jgi:PTS system mannose-specific IIC component
LIGDLLLVGLWGVLVGIDMTSVAQTMLSRPLVAATVAGVILGDPAGGLMMGVLLELFALEVLPVGAARYPDCGLGAVAAVAVVAGSPGVLSTGLGGALGLAVAYLGGVAAHVTRMVNGADVVRNAAALDAGDKSVIYWVHVRGVLRDCVRSMLVVAIGLSAACAMRLVLPITLQGAVYLRIVVVGAAIAAVVSGTVRLTGRRIAMQWFVLGLVGGIVGVVLQ